MNKKFLLLPLTAMTASIHATQPQETNFNTITGPYKNLIQHSIANSEDFGYFSENNSQINNNFLNSEQNDISIKKLYLTLQEADQFEQRFHKNDAQTANELINKAKAIKDKQKVKFEAGETFNEIIFTTDVEKNLNFEDLSTLEPDQATHAATIQELNTIFSTEINTALTNLQITQTDQFYTDQGQIRIAQFPNEIKENEKQEIITQAITQALNGIDINKYKVQLKKFTKSQIIPNAQYKADKQYSLPTKQNGEIDTESIEYQTLLTKLTEQQENIQKLQPKLTPIQEAISKTHQNVQKAIQNLLPDNELTETIQTDQIITELNNIYKQKTNTKAQTIFITKLQKTAPELYQSLIKQIQTINPQQSKTEKIMQYIYQTQFDGKKIYPETIYRPTDKQFNFIPGMQTISLDNMDKLYTNLLLQKSQGQKILKSTDPQKWNQQDYLKAINLVIPNEQTAQKYGIKPAQIKNQITQEKCINDIKTFNAWQKAKFTIVYKLLHETE